MAASVWGNHVAGFEGRGEDVEDEEAEVPGEDEEVDEGACDFVDETHVLSPEDVGRGRDCL